MKQRILWDAQFTFLLATALFVLIVLALLELDGCASVGPSALNLPTIEAMSTRRQVELERLFDATATDTDTTAQSIAQIISLEEREAQFVSALWGRRSTLSQQACRIGCGYLAAYSGTRPEVLRWAHVWLARALESLPAGDFIAAGEIRCDIAEAFVAAGDTRSAVEVLANRIDSRPFTPELEARYRSLLDRIAREETNRRSGNTPATGS